MWHATCGEVSPPPLGPARRQFRRTGDLESRASAFVQARNPIQESQLRKGPGRLGTDTGAWNPHQVLGLKSGSVALEGARFLHLGLAEDGSGQVTMFVVNHGT
jgi:hypothetical protein